MTQALIFSEFLQRLQVPAPHFPSGVWSAHIFPMQASTSLSAPVLRRGPPITSTPGETLGALQPHTRPAAGSQPQYAIWVKASNIPRKYKVGCWDHHCTLSKQAQASLSRDALYPCCANGHDKSVTTAPHELSSPKVGVTHSQKQLPAERKQRLKLLHTLGRATKSSSLGTTLGPLHTPSPTNQVSFSAPVHSIPPLHCLRSSYKATGKYRQTLQLEVWPTLPMRLQWSETLVHFLCECHHTANCPYDSQFWC